MKVLKPWKRTGTREISNIPLERIVSSPYQPRSRYDLQDIGSLAASIARYGVLSPLLVRKIRGNVYEVIAGERRLRACQQLGLKEVPSIVVDLSEAETPAALLSERLQQTNLSAVERAEAYDRLMRDFGGAPRELAKMLGVSVSEITAQMELLRLSAGTRRMMEEHGIEGERMQEAMKEPKEEKKVLFSVLQSEIDSEEAEKKKTPLVQEIYGNTIKKTIGMLNLAGATADGECIEKEDCVEYIIRIPK